MNFAVKLAHAILDLEAERDMLAREVAHLRGVEEEFEELLTRSNSHHQHMLGSILELAMKPGVLEAISNSNQGEPRG